MASTADAQHISHDRFEIEKEDVTVLLDASLVRAADELGLDVAEACDRGLREAVTRTRRAREWYEENKEAVDAHNAWIEKHGLILSKYRTF